MKYLASLQGTKPIAGQVDPGREHTIVLLSEQSINPTPNGLSLYPQMGEFFKPHQRDSWLQQMEINRDQQLTKIQRIRHRRCLALKGKYIPCPHCQNVRGKEVKRWKEPELVHDYEETLSSRHSRGAVHVNQQSCDSRHKI